MKFIKLTEILSTGEAKPIFINFDHVQHFSAGRKGKDTHVRMSDKSFFFVGETVEKILEMIYIDNTRPPIMMDAGGFEKYKKALKV